MIRSLAILLLTLLARAAFAQPVVDERRHVDSLLQLQRQGASDSIRARASFLLSDFWSYSDTVKARAYLEEGKRLAEGNAYMEAESYFYEAGLIFDTDIEKALALYAEAARRFSPFHTTESYLLQARAWRNSGALLQRQSKGDEMVKIILTRAVPLAEKAGDHARVGSFFTDVGMVFMNEQQYDKAAYYFEKSLAYYAQGHPTMHDELTTTLFAANNYAYLDSLAPAKRMIDRAARLLEPFPGSEFYIDYAIGATKYYRAAKQYAQGLEAATRGIALAEKLNKPYKRAELLYQQYEMYTGLRQYQAALEVLRITIAETPHDLDNNRLLYYKSMADTYERLGNIPEAHAWLKRFNEVRDSVYPERLKQEIAQIETKYNAAEKEKRIIQLQAEKQDAIMTQRNQRLMNWLLGVAGLLLLLATLSLVFIYRTSKKQARQKLKEIAQQQELRIANALLEGEEKERRRVARDLHDGLGGSLAGIRIKLAGHPPSAQTGEVISMLEGSMTELRRIAHNMMPESLLKMGLQSAVTDLCDTLTHDGLDIEFQPAGIRPDLSHTAQANIYRIVQELLSNAIRHGKASKVLLQCIQNDSLFFITAEDNGRGFDTQAATGGMGLSNIRSRVGYMKGRLDVDSTPGGGTVVNIELHV